MIGSLTLNQMSPEISWDTANFSPEAAPSNTSFASMSSKMGMKPGGTASATPPRQQGPPTSIGMDYR